MESGRQLDVPGIVEIDPVGQLLRQSVGHVGSVGPAN